MLTQRIALGLLLVVGVMDSSASAQSPQRPIVGTWRGSENLDGFGSLTFVFHDNGAATMYDARSTVKGSWTRSGTSVVITFVNCQYTGSLNSAGTFLSGTAYFTQGPDRRQWSFSVQR